MSYEHILEPVRRLRYAWKMIRPKDMKLQELKMGETFLLDTVAHQDHEESLSN